MNVLKVKIPIATIMILTLPKNQSNKRWKHTLLTLQKGNIDNILNYLNRN